MLFSPGEYSRLRSGGKWKTADCELNCSQSDPLIQFQPPSTSPGARSWRLALCRVRTASKLLTLQTRSSDIKACLTLALALVLALRSLNFPGYHFYPLYKGHLLCPSFLDNQKQKLDFVLL